MNALHRALHAGARLVAAAGCCALFTAAAAPPAVHFVHGAPYAVAVQTQKGVRFAATMRQQYDYSCGSAAIATLLTYHYGTPTGEEAVFEEMFRHGEPERIQRDGFSMLDMKNYLARRGFEADGFELPLDKLAEARVPAIVLISDNGYQHFVVVKGLRDGRVLVGDSATGTRAMSRARFEALWQNCLLFVIHTQQLLASFNAAADWALHPAAPLAAGVVRDSLGALTLPRLGVNEN